MVRRISMSDDCFHMFFGRVSHVPFPSVLRILQSKFSHIFIPVCLGQYGCRGDAGIFAVSLYHALIAVTVEWLEFISIYKKKFRLDAQPADCPLHTGNGCIQNIYCIDFFCTDFFYCPSDSFPLDDRAERLPCLFCHFLGVVQEWMVEILRQYDCSCEDRTGQRAASCLVASCFNQVCVKEIQKMMFIVHSAKIHNLSVFSYFLSISIIWFLVSMISSWLLTSFLRYSTSFSSSAMRPAYSSFISLRFSSGILTGLYPRTSSSVEVSRRWASLITLQFTILVLPFSRSLYAVREIPSLWAISSCVSPCSFLILLMLSLMEVLSISF